MSSIETSSEGIREAIGGINRAIGDVKGLTAKLNAMGASLNDKAGHSSQASPATELARLLALLGAYAGEVCSLLEATSSALDKAALDCEAFAWESETLARLHRIRSDSDTDAYSDRI